MSPIANWPTNKLESKFLRVTCGIFAVKMAFCIPYLRRIIPDFLLNIINPNIQMIAFFTVKKHTWGHTYIKPAKWLSATWNMERMHANMPFLLHKQQQIQKQKHVFWIYRVDKKKLCIIWVGEEKTLLLVLRHLVVRLDWDKLKCVYNWK